MKHLVLIIVLLLGAASVNAQVSSGNARRLTSGTAVPNWTCSPGPNYTDFYLRTTTDVLYFCSAAPATWSVFATAGGGAGTVTTSGSPASPQLAKFSSATAITTATATDVSTPSQCADAGASDTYACNLAPAIASYVVGTKLRFFANTANTGAASINFNTVGALTIVKMAGGVTTALADNDIRAGQWVEGTIAASSNFQMTSQIGNSASASPGGSDTQVQFNDSSAFGGDAGLTYNKTTNVLTNTDGQIVSTGGTITASTPGLAITQTWNDAGVVFKGLTMTITDTASAGTARFAEFLVGSNSLFKFSKAGVLDVDAAGLGTGQINVGTDARLIANRIYNPSGGGGFWVGSAGATNAVHIDGVSLDIAGVGSDAATTNNTLCITTTTNLVTKGSGTIGVCLGTSSARYKHNINPLSSGLDMISRLQAKRFFYNKGYGDDGAREQVGYLAEDMVKVAPQLVGLDAEKRPNSVDVIGLIPVMTNAINELNIRLTKLERENRQLRRRLRRK